MNLKRVIRSYQILFNIVKHRQRSFLSIFDRSSLCLCCSCYHLEIFSKLLVKATKPLAHQEDIGLSMPHILIKIAQDLSFRDQELYSQMPYHYTHMHDKYGYININSTHILLSLTHLLNKKIIKTFLYQD